VVVVVMMLPLRALAVMVVVELGKRGNETTTLQQGFSPLLSPATTT
jgi:hypothetical protein